MKSDGHQDSRQVQADRAREKARQRDADAQKRQSKYRLSNAAQLLNAIGIATDIRIRSVCGVCQGRRCIDAA
jgi:hypothetical protein